MLAVAFSSFLHTISPEHAETEPLLCSALTLEPAKATTFPVVQISPLALFVVCIHALILCSPERVHSWFLACRQSAFPAPTLLCR